MKRKASFWWGALLLAVMISASAVRAQVRINEVMADNGGSVIAPGGGTPDYIELFNTNVSAVSIAGWKLSSQLNVTNAFVYTFPAGTAIAGTNYLLLWLDNLTNGPGPGLHVTTFTLSSKGGAVSLYNNANLVQDEIPFGFQITDKTLGRFPNGKGAWTLCSPTPGATNRALTLGTQRALRLNEWMPTNSAGVDKDRLEIYNLATNGPVSLGGASGVQITGNLTAPDTTTELVLSNSFIDSGGFVRFTCDNNPPKLGQQADHTAFRLSSSSGETISIYLSNKTTLVDQIKFGTFTNLPFGGRDISMGRFPDGSTNIVFFNTNDTTLGSANLQAQKITNFVVNEVLTHTDPPLEDALELYNPTADPVDISKWWISNSQSDPFKFRVPTNTLIADASYKVFFEQNTNNGATNGYGFNHNGTGNSPEFTFNSAHGDQVVITYYGPYAPFGGSNVAYQLVHDIFASDNGVSFGRYIKSDGGADLVPMKARTFGVDNPLTVPAFRTSGGLLNVYPRIGPVVISEIMFHPPDIGTNDNSIDEYIELTSITNAVQPLFDPAYPTNTWSLQGAVSYAFPTNVSLPAFGRLLLVNFDPFTNAPQLAAFRALYGVSNNVQVFGPLGGKLANSSETLYLFKPDAVQLPPHPDAGYVPQVYVERVKYEDIAPWPTNTDGTGFSLQRLSLTGYANDQTNWYGASPTAGRTNAQPTHVFPIGAVAGNSFKIGVVTTPGRAYTVEGSTNLAINNWVTITNFTANATNCFVTNSAALNLFHYRFYRARGF